MSRRRRKSRRRRPRFISRQIEAIELEGTNLPLLEVSRVTEIQCRKSKKEFIYLEKQGKKWTVTYTNNTIPSKEQLKAINFIRTEDIYQDFVPGCSLEENR